MLSTIEHKKNVRINYLFVLPAFTFLMLIFQTEAFAQETSEANYSSIGVTRTESLIKSTTTDKELYEQEKSYNNEFGLSLKFKTILRNKNGEIKGLKIILSDGKDIKKAYNVSEDDPIKPFTIFVDKDENNDITFGFGDASSSLLVAENNKNQKVAELNAASESKAAAEKKSRLQSDESDSSEIVGDDDISVLRRDKNINYKKAYISLNGKEISPAEMEKIDPKSIGSISTMNNRNNDKIVEEYGEKARNGVILIETMFVVRELSTKDINDLPKDFKLDRESGAFIIHKNSQPSDLEFYKKHLALIGVKLEISELERNVDGFITSVKIKLHDEIEKVQMANWVAFSSANAIVNIFVGRKNGKINISTR